MEQLAKHKQIGNSIFEVYIDNTNGRVVFIAYNYDGTDNYIVIENRTVLKDDIIDAIKKVGGDFDTWTKVHPYSAVHEALMFAMMNDIQNEYVDFLRYVYMTDIDFTQLMKNGKATFTKEMVAKLEYVDKNDTQYNFHKIVKRGE